MNHTSHIVCETPVQLVLVLLEIFSLENHRPQCYGTPGTPELEIPGTIISRFHWISNANVAGFFRVRLYENIVITTNEPL